MIFSEPRNTLKAEESVLNLILQGEIEETSV